MKNISHKILKGIAFVAGAVVTFTMLGLSRESPSSVESEQLHGKVGLNVLDTHNLLANNLKQIQDSPPLSLGRRGALDELRAAMQGYSTHAFSTKLQELLASKESFSNRTLACELIEAWTERFPDEARAFVMEPKRAKELYYYHRVALVDGLLARAPEETLRWLEERQEGERDLGIYADAIGKVAQTDPELAYRFATETETGNRDWFLGEFFENLVQRDPALSIDYLSKVKKGRSRNNIMSQIASEWTKLDPPAALSWASKLNDPKERERTLQACFFAFDRIAPRESFEARKSFLLEGGLKDIYSLSSIFGGLSIADSRTAIQWAGENLPKEDAKKLTAEYLLTLAYNHPIEAINKILQGDATSYQQARLLPQALETWMHRDSSACLEWIQQHTGEIAPDDIEGLLSSHKGSQEPPPFETLWEIAQLLPEGEMRRRSTKDLVAAWAAEDRVACFELLETLPEGPQRDALYGATLMGLATLDADAAFMELAKRPDGDERIELAKDLANSMGRAQPDKAVRLLQEYKMLDEDNFAVAFSTWSDRDPIGAAQWLGELPEGPVRQKAIFNLSSKLSEKDPDKATQWAMQLEAPSQRRKALIAVARAWIARDKDAGYAWVERSALSAEDKAAFMRRRLK